MSHSVWGINAKDSFTDKINTDHCRLVFLCAHQKFHKSAPSCLCFSCIANVCHEHSKYTWQGHQSAKAGQWTCKLWIARDGIQYTTDYESKDPKHTRLKEHFLIGRNRTKYANFWGSPLFQATCNIKTGKQTINSTWASNWHEHISWASNWHKISWFNCLFSCLYVAGSLKKRTSFSLLCVSDLFPKHWQTTLFQIFFPWIKW